MLSNTCKTAIKAVIYLASKFDSGEKSAMKDVADHIGASEHTVGKILQTLVKQGLIHSVKGPSGGFYISKEQQKFPIIKIVEAIDGKQIFKECGLGLDNCSSKHPCPIHDEYKIIRDLTEKMFSTRKLIDLCDPVKSGLTYLAG